jgi:hypothetical protein
MNWSTHMWNWGIIGYLHAVCRPKIAWMLDCMMFLYKQFYYDDIHIIIYSSSLDVIVPGVLLSTNTNGLVGQFYFLKQLGKVKRRFLSSCEDQEQHELLWRSRSRTILFANYNWNFQVYSYTCVADYTVHILVCKEL